MVKPSLQLTIGQKLSMTPQLQQAIRLLQLSTQELKTEIESALVSNSMLEVQEVQDTQKEETLPAYWHVSKKIKVGNEIETLNGTSISLRDHLLWQMDLTPLSELDKMIATLLIDSINEDGFLTCSLPDIVSTVKHLGDIEEDEVEAVLHRIQQCDPLGSGARDLGECLKIQIEHAPQFPHQKKAKELVTRYLKLLGKRDYPALKRRLGLSLEELREIIHAIQTLNPRPGSIVGQNRSEYIIPDIYIVKQEGKWVVQLNNENTPRIQINHHYASLIQRGNQNTDNQFLRHQLQEARWFLKSIETRNETLLKVAECIVSEQQDFLDHGEEAMKPLVLNHIASKINMHESTISRVTSQKYCHTPRGIFELKYFFGEGIDTHNGGECSATAIRALIKKLIQNENQQKPFSDSKLSELLSAQGINIARRTIAKYREAMMILPSHERKTLTPPSGKLSPSST